MILPGGIGAAIADVRDGYLRWVARRRDLLVPSLLADRRDDPVAIPPELVEDALEVGRRRADPGAPRCEQARRTRMRSDVTGGGALFPLLVLFGLNAVDQVDQRTFALLAPNIRDNFHLDNSAFLLIVALGLVLGLLLSIPFGFAADRVPRLPIAIGGAIAFGLFSMLTGLATTVLVLVIARAGSGFGTAVSNPTHNSLLADYYDIPSRPKVYSVHRAALAVGACLGPLIAGLLTSWFSWRVPFIVLIVPTTIFVVLAFFLKEPVRGHFEREAMGADAETIATEVAAPSYAESWRVCWNVGTLRRIFYALPFLAVAFIGLEIFGSLYYEQVFHLDARDRGFVFALIAPAQLIGLLLTTRIVTRLFVKSATLIPRFVAVVALAVAVAWTAFALAPNLGIAIVAQRARHRHRGADRPADLRRAVARDPAEDPLVRVRRLRALDPARPGPAAGRRRARRRVGHPRRSHPDGARVPDRRHGHRVGRQGDREGHQAGLDLGRRAVGGALRAPPGPGEAAARAAGVSVHYDSVQVLFNVDLEVDEGEIVALLGTNGAGKSTLLKAIGGLVDPSDGAIVFDGRDMTYTPAERDRASAASRWCPAARASSPSLTVAREPPARGLAAPQGHGPRQGRDRAGPRDLPDPPRPAGRSPPATSPAASSRCSRSAWRSSRSRACS